MMKEIEGESGKALKRSMVGVETEYHLIDNKGKIAPKAPAVIAAVLKRGDYPITKEIGKNMIELGCYPDIFTFNPSLHLINTLEVVLEEAQKRDMKIYPFSTYPGAFEPTISGKSEHYKLKYKIFGKERADHTMRVVGFHHHYTLPKGVFDANNLQVRIFKKSKLKRSLVGSYNLEIAADPILTLFMQSSPFYQGKHLAKDSRMVVYRGGKKLDYMNGTYANLQQIGGLPPYKQTATDLMTSLHKRYARWEREVMTADPTANFDKLYPVKMDIGWNPIKINKHGTLEQRGMDVSYVSQVVATTVLLKFFLKHIQREFIEVIPADFGMKEAFKIEGNIMYIPPHTLVRNKLQKASAYEGYADKEMHHYAKRFYDFAKSVTPKAYSTIIAPIGEMVSNKQSMSDKIIAYAKRKGYWHDGKITKTDSAELALHYADMMPKDLEAIKQALKKIAPV